MKYGWDEVTWFHGHICPGLAMGYRAAQEALRFLGTEAASDEELVAIVENDACGVDALQMLTSCTLGKGNLIFRDYGKPVYTIGNRRTGEAVRVIMRSLAWEGEERSRELGDRVKSGLATPAEREEWEALRQKYLELILKSPASAFLALKAEKLELPPKARIFGSVSCSYCGERVMEPRARIRDGQPVCIPCSVEYSRGW